MRTDYHLTATDQLLNLIHAEIAAAGARHQVSAHIASDISMSVEESMRRQLGGLLVRVPCFHDDTRERDAAIRRAREAGMSWQAVGLLMGLTGEGCRKIYLRSVARTTLIE